MTPTIKLVPHSDEQARLVKPGDRNEALLAEHGQNFVTQTRIDALPSNYKRQYRGVGLLRYARRCLADWRSRDMQLSPAESKQRPDLWSREK